MTVQTWRGLLRTMRPQQWVKNLFVLAPAVFAGQLFEPPIAARAGLAVLLFCAASSSIYILNDVIDVEADRAHPVKCRRPIASGQVPVRLALGIGLALALTAIGVGYALAPLFAAAVAGYLVLNLAYCLGLKRVAYVDVISIALGFELRVLAGAAAIAVPASVYLLVVTFLLALFLGFGKRMHELTQGEAAHKQRSVLKAYSHRTLDVLLYVTAAATVTTYVAYTLEPDTRQQFGTDYLIVTALFTVLGVLRFLHLVSTRPEAESPTEEMLHDKPFLLNLAFWMVSVVVVVYWT